MLQFIKGLPLFEKCPPFLLQICQNFISFTNMHVFCLKGQPFPSVFRSDMTVGSLCAYLDVPNLFSVICVWRREMTLAWCLSKSSPGDRLRLDANCFHRPAGKIFFK